MKMQLKQRRQAVLQLHLSEQQLYTNVCLILDVFTLRFPWLSAIPYHLNISDDVIQNGQ